MASEMNLQQSDLTQAPHNADGSNDIAFEGSESDSSSHSHEHENGQVLVAAIPFSRLAAEIDALSERNK